MQRSQQRNDLIFYLLISLITGVLFFCFSPYRMPDPHRDSGIFLNIGSEILRGKVLYLQTWDNKQPLLYFINALGLWLGQRSVWGVWGVELVFLLTTVLTGYRILRQKLPPFSSFTVVTISFLTIFPFLGGNYSEEYALLFQIGILAVVCFVYLPDRNRYSRALAAVCIGCLAGLSFTVKQTYLDVSISALALILFLGWVKKDHRVIFQMAYFGLGFILANLPFWLYFSLHGALRDYLTGAFLFNRYYVSLGLLEWINGILEKIEFVTSTPMLMLISSIWLGSIFILLVRGRKYLQGFAANSNTRWITLAVGCAAWTLFGVAQVRGSSRGMGLLEWATLITGSIALLAAVVIFRNKSNPRSRNPSGLTDLRNAFVRMDWQLPGTAPLLFLGLIDLPAVLLTISLSGKDFTHYYISLFPAVFLLLAAGLSYVVPIVARTFRAINLNLVLAALLVITAFGPVLQVYAFLSNPGKGDARLATAAYLQSVTAPEDKILMWGWEAGIYFLANREPPTRYAFQFPAYLESPYQQSVLSTLLADLQNDPPAYIADTRDAGMPLIEGRPGKECLSGSQAKDAQLLAILSFVCSNYDFDRTFEYIYVYKLRDVSKRLD